MPMNSSRRDFIKALGAVPAAKGLNGLQTYDLGTEILDQTGLERSIQGVNIVPRGSQNSFVDEEQITEKDLHKISQDLELDTLRLGALWSGIEPERGEYSDEYIDSFNRLVERAETHGLDVLVEMHQDLYSHEMSGDGAPSWACPEIPSEGLGDFNDYGFWQLRYLSEEVSRGFSGFWENREGIRSRYVECLGNLADELSEHDNVIGIEPMNEPVPGMDVEGLDDLIELPREVWEFESEELADFYRECSEKVREVFPEVPLFIEPSAATFNAGLGTNLGDPLGDRTVFSYHSYAPLTQLLGDLGFEEDALSAYSMSKHRTIFENAREYSESTGTPAVLTEFSGGMEEREVSRLMDYSEENSGWMYWQFKEDGDIWVTESQPWGEWGLVDGKGKRYQEIISER